MHKNDPSIPIGTAVYNEALDGKAPKLVVEPDSKYTLPIRLDRHLQRKWFLDHVREHFDLDLTPVDTDFTEECSVPLSLLAKHGVIIGSSGSGKSHLALHLLREQLKAGCSAVVIDVKDKTLSRALDFALEAGLTQEQITIVLPRCAKEGVPAWNPLLGDPESVRERVSGFKDIIRLGSESWGAQMDNLLESAATVMASLELSLVEMYEFLLDEEYRSGLLARARKTPFWDEFKLRYEYFEREYPEIAKSGSVQSVLSRIRHMVDNRYLRAMFCAKRDSLNLASLWQKQRLLLVHMDTAAIGDEGVRFLAGILSESLLRTAMKHSGPVPVLLFLDEMGYQGPYLSRSLTRILAIAREQNLRLLIAAQHLGQLNVELQEAALTSTAFRAFFRLGDKDADYVTKRLGSEINDEARRIVLNPTNELNRVKFRVQACRREGGEYEYVQLPGHLVAEHGLGTNAEAKSAVRFNVWRYFRLLRQAGYLIDKTRMPFSVEPIPQHLQGLTCADVSATRYGYEIQFPKFKLTMANSASRSDRLREITRMLSTMPPRHAVIKSDKDRMALVQVANVEFSEKLPQMEDYLGTGQNAEEIREVSRSRYETIAAIKQPQTVEVPGEEVRAVKQPKSTKPPEKPKIFNIPNLKLTLPTANAGDTPSAEPTETNEQTKTI